MAGGGMGRVTRSRDAFAIPVVAVALVVAATVLLWTRGDLNTLICDGDCGPAYIIAPDSLTDATRPASALPDPAMTEPADADKVAKAVRGALEAKVLGPRVGFVALDPASGDVLASRGKGTFVPASTTKVLTGFAALTLIDPQQRFTTKVVDDDGAIVLVGGGDPYLATKRTQPRDPVVRADLATLARRTAAALKEAGTTTVRLGFDASLFTGPRASPDWEDTYVTGNIVTPVSALWADQGVDGGIRARDPAAAAAKKFAGLLDDRGITVSGEPEPRSSPQGAATLASVRSATVAQIVGDLIRTSDNQAAEVMLRQAAIAAGEPATFDGGTAAVVSTLKEAGIDVTGIRLHDGSGLSRAGRISPTTLAQTVRAAAQSSNTSGLVTDLPVNGFNGTLLLRLSSARGLIHAKTGTLTGVHSLAGYAVDAGGRPVVFAVMTDRADRSAPLGAQAALDKVAAAIATCSCG